LVFNLFNFFNIFDTFMSFSENAKIKVKSIF
jgi:hypothetical protein